MANVGELEAEMYGLDDEARAILANPNLTVFQRRRTLDELLSRYRVLEHYKQALAAFIRRMKAVPGQRPLDPEEVIRELLASPEFSCLRLVVLAVLVAVVYPSSRRHWRG